MGFWIFMLIMDLLIPALMIGFGLLFRKKAPKNINVIFGYRTCYSMKNLDTWEFAHHYLGKLWLITGIPLAVLSTVSMLFCLGESINYTGIFGTVVCVVQLVVIIIPVIYTEAALRRNFDENGRHKHL